MKNKVYELANLLKILFIGFDKKSDNKALKQQLKYILKYLQEPNKTNEVIEDLINDFDIFNEEDLCAVSIDEGCYVRMRDVNTIMEALIENEEED